jgi:hypothetical protein
VAKLVDALGSGPSGGNTVEVRVLSWAPDSKVKPLTSGFTFCVKPDDPILFISADFWLVRVGLSGWQNGCQAVKHRFTASDIRAVD